MNFNLLASFPENHPTTDPFSNESAKDWKTARQYHVENDFSSHVFGLFLRTYCAICSRWFSSESDNMQYIVAE